MALFGTTYTTQNQGTFDPGYGRLLSVEESGGRGVRTMLRSKSGLDSKIFTG